MPTLFISYKRGTSAVAPLMERLQSAHYRLWFDRDEIHLGDPDWQARINQGIERCDGLILNLTPAACASEPVQYEVKKAQELGKPIFPIVLEKIEDWDAALTQVGLTPNQHMEDFTDVTKWDQQIQRLLHDLEIQGLRVTSHDRRQQRDRNNPNYVLHQTYLKRLVERIGILNLAQINPDNAQRVKLERVYMDSPTGLSISVEVQNWQVVKWWIDVQRQFGNDEDDFATIKYQPDDTIFERAALETLLEKVNDCIHTYRQENPDKKPEGENSWRNRWNNGIHENVIKLHLNHLAAAQDRLVILGTPGSGKSTFVKYLALCLAGAGIDDWKRKVDITSLDNWPHEILTPIYIELRRFVKSRYFPTDVKTPATADHLWAYICADVVGDSLHAYADDLRYDLEHGQAVLILDGLDEVPYPEGKLKDRQNQLIDLANSLNTRYATSRIIVTSRPYAYEGWKLPEFETITITGFSDTHRVDLAQKLYQVAGLNEESAHEKAQALNHQLRKIDPELQDRPLFVTLMATIYLKGEQEGLPTRRGALYRESILLLLDRWTTSKPNTPSLIDLLGDHSLFDLYDRLAALAYEVHINDGDQPGTPEIDESLLYKYLKSLGRTTAAELIPYLSENAGVLVSPGQDDEKDVFQFAHRTFQEYLAGEHMVSLCVEADSFQLVRNHIMEKPQIWRIPCTLAGDVLADTERRGDLWDLLDDLVDDDVPDKILADDPRWWSVWLASTVLQEQKMLGNEKLRRSERAVCDQLRAWTLALIETPFALANTERWDCGNALSLLGDTRAGVGVNKSGLPDIEWVTIPAGEFSYQDGTMTLDYDFQIARYPVTYAQFQTFLDDPEGYPDKERWFEDLFEDLYEVSEDYGIINQTLQYANHPRRLISWHEVIAFCRWLSWRLDVIKPPNLSPSGLGTYDPMNPETWAVRLPTEFEWEKAARANTGWAYPYGDKFDASKGNAPETGIGQTSAVGIFLAGDTPHWDKPITDLSGNVWEWCLTNYDNPKIKAVDENLSSRSNRVLRGGSWDSYNVDNFRYDYRYGLNPFSTSNDFGFRLCRPLSL